MLGEALRGPCRLPSSGKGTIYRDDGYVALCMDACWERVSKPGVNVGVSNGRFVKEPSADDVVYTDGVSSDEDIGERGLPGSITENMLAIKRFRLGGTYPCWNSPHYLPCISQSHPVRNSHAWVYAIC